MKMLWNAMAVLAIANLLGIIGFVLWLKSSDRLDSTRVQKIRELLSVTISEEASKQAVETKKAGEEQKAAEQVAKRTGEAETSAEAIDKARDKQDAQAASMLRVKEEIKQLQASLLKQQADLDRDKAGVEALRKRLEAKQAEINKVGGTAQFKQALAALEAQKAPAARQVLQALISENKREEALDYLAAMDETKRAKVMTEFIKADERLAAGLLESLRLRGVVETRPATAAAPGTTP